MPTVTILGPQRLKPTVARAVADRKVTGKIATITAGWQEREAEDQELDEHLEGRTFNLFIYRRTEEIYKADPSLRRTIRERQDTLRSLQRLYRIRLSHSLDAARELLLLPPDAKVEAQIRGAIETIRSLDAEHLGHVGEIHAEYESKLALDTRDVVVRQRTELARLLEEENAGAIAIAGGHVAVLLNRLRLFDVPRLLGRRHLFAWSAGAMATSERIVLFHDSPPQGPGNAEVLERGLGLHSGLLPLPHAESRLRLGDRLRVELFARRFAPDLCVALGQGDWVDRTATGWKARRGARQLAPTGKVQQMVAA